MLFFLIVIYGGVVLFAMYRIFKLANRKVETIYLLVSSGILAFVMTRIRDDVGYILMTISAILLILYIIVMRKTKGRKF